MNKLYEVLEICLNEIEQGTDVDTVLFRYPDLANELRPILEASVKAKGMAVPAPSQEVVRRNRAKLLQHAAQMREQKSVIPARRIWSVPLRRALVTLMIVAMMFVSGNGLVRASSTTLPGDNLYPVKRTWEGFQLFFTFDVTERETLELEHENERLEELRELISKGRSAPVEFSGYVTSQAGSEWQIDGVKVVVSLQTKVPDQPVVIGDAVRVKGQVQSDGLVVAEEIKLLAPGSVMPEVDGRETEFEEPDVENSNQKNENNSISGSETETPEPAVILTPTLKSKVEDISLEGSVTSVENAFVVVNGVVMDISKAEVEGSPQIGTIAKAEGYYDTSGIFIVTKIEFKVVSYDEGSSTSGNTNDDVNVNDNSNDDHEDNTNSGNNNNGG